MNNYLVETHCMADINRIREYCKSEDVTVNAYIAAAFALAYKSYTAGEEARFVCIKEDGELSVDLLCEPDSTVSSFVSSFKDLTGTAFRADDLSFEYSIGDKIELRCESSSYDEYTIKGFLRTFDNMATEIAQKERLSDVCGTNEDDEKAIKELYDSYHPVKERPAYRLLEDSCAKYPERKALIACDRTLTFKELNEEANALGNVLHDQGVGPETIVAVMPNRNSYAYVMRQGILKSGGAFLPIDPEYPKDRISFILEDSGAKIIVAEKETIDEKEELFNELSSSGIKIIDVRTAVKEGSKNNPGVEVPYDALCYVIYTSGTTGRPKGVMLTNKNLVNFVDDNEKNREIRGYTEKGHVSLAIAALTFDVSIMEEMIPIANGLTSVLATKEEIMNPLALADLMLKENVDIMTATPSYLMNLLDIGEIDPRFNRAFMKVLSVDIGAEAFPASLYDKIISVNPNVHIMNGYGPTEATISCTMQVIKDPQNITIGLPNVNVHLATMDRDGRLQVPGALGEMVIMGDGVGRGYIGREDLNKKSFINLLGMKAYKSGDLVRIREDGEIEFHGRIDNQVKLRGLRVELGEIESVMSSYPGIRSNVVIVVKKETEFLAAYFTADSPIDISDLKSYLSSKLTEYMVPGVFMQLNEMPLTANGKIDKRSLPKIGASQTKIVEPKNDAQKQIMNIAGEVISNENIGITTDLFSAGLSSIGCMKLCILLSEYSGKNIDVTDIYENDTVEKIEKFLDRAQDKKTYEVLDEYPLSMTQKGIFFECMMYPDSTTYNIPELYTLDPSVDIPRLCDAAERAVRIHPYLFMAPERNDEGEIIAKRRDDMPFKTTVGKYKKLPSDEELVRPFAIESGEALFRIEIYETEQGNFLLIDTHHIVSDGESLDILKRDIDRFYRDEACEKEELTGYEVALEERDLRKGARYTEAKAWYDSIFKGCGGETAPARDGNAEGSDIGVYKTRITDEAGPLNSFCNENGLTFNSYFTAAFALALKAFTSSETVVFSTIYNGRKDIRLANSVSMLVKTFPVLLKCDQDKSIKETIEECQRFLLSSMANDIYSFAEIREAYGIKADILFAYQGEYEEYVPIGGKPAAYRTPGHTRAMADLSLDVFIDGGDVVLETEYDPGAYSEDRVKELISVLSLIISLMPERTKVSELFTDPKDKVTSPDKTQERLLAVAKSVLGNDAVIDEDTDLFTVGLTSLGSIKLCTLISREFECNITVSDIFESRTVKGLEKKLGNSDADSFEIKEKYPLSLTQMGIFVECIRYTGSTVYNIPYLYRLDKDTDMEGLYSAILKVLDAHPYLSMTIEKDDDGNAFAKRYETNKIIPERGTVLPAREELIRPFDLLSGEPLCRIGLYDTEKGKYFFIDAHHIVCDGESLSIIMDDINKAFEGEDIGKERFTGYEAALVEEKDRASDKYSRAKDWYHNVFDDCGSETLPLSVDTEGKGSIGTYTVCSEDGASRVRVFCDKNRFSLNAFFTTAFGLSLMKSAKTDKAVFSTIYNGRSDPRTKDTVGMLVKTLPVLIKKSPAAENTIAIRDCQKLLLDAMSNDIFSFSEVRTDFSIEGHVMFAFQGDNDENGTIKICGKPAVEEEVSLSQTKSAFSLDLSLEGDHIKYEFEYDPNKYGKQSIEGFYGTMQETVKELCGKEVEKPKELETAILEIFRKTLGIDGLGSTDDFFENGGTSLLASKVMIAAMVKNIPVTFQDVFNAPTAEKLALLMESRLSAASDAAPSSSDEKAAEEERSDYNGVLCRNTKENLDNITAEDLGKVLVTGATGFLGIHVVKELLDQGYGKIYCLVRRTEVMPKKRLMEIMFYYFGEIDEEAFDSKVIAIEGDITDTGSLEVIKTLDIDTVINCAACVKHFADIDYLKKINVTGVENLANICAKMRARLIQISTVSVAGDYTEDGKGPAVLTEDKLDIGQIVDNNAYVFSKYLAERVMLDAIANKGLDGKIIRVGNLMSRQIDGEFQVNFRTNSFMRILKAYVVLKCFPVDEMDMKDEFSPIDEVAKAITLLAGTDSDFTVFHAYNSHTVDMGDIIFSLRDLGFTINIVDDKTFKKRLERALKDERINSSVSPLVSYNNNDGSETLENEVDNTFTVKALYRLGFRWKITDNGYINKSMTMLDELGFFGSALY